MTIYLALIKIVLLAVLRPEFCAVAGNQFTSYQIEVLCSLNGCPENLFNGLWIIPAKV